jgi:hypothetical protein
MDLLLSVLSVLGFSGLVGGGTLLWKGGAHFQYLKDMVEHQKLQGKIDLLTVEKATLEGRLKTQQDVSDFNEKRWAQAEADAAKVNQRLAEYEAERARHPQPENRRTMELLNEARVASSGTSAVLSSGFQSFRLIPHHGSRVGPDDNFEIIFPEDHKKKNP